MALKAFIKSPVSICYKYAHIFIPLFQIDIVAKSSPDVIHRLPLMLLHTAHRRYICSQIKHTNTCTPTKLSIWLLPPRRIRNLTAQRAVAASVFALVAVVVVAIANVELQHVFHCVEPR